MLNIIDKDFSAQVQSVSAFTKKGRHTTTRIFLHEFSFGGIVYDMPGLKEIDFVDILRIDLRNYYPEFLNLPENCKFKNCTHSHEKDCSIKRLVNQSIIHPIRYQNYLQILSFLKDSW